MRAKKLFLGLMVMAIVVLGIGSLTSCSKKEEYQI